MKSRPDTEIRDAELQILTGDNRKLLARLPAESVQSCVTSPPYWGLRDYEHVSQIGAEPTPEQYVANLVEIFREVRRVLRKDGTLWLNVGEEKYVPVPNFLTIIFKQHLKFFQTPENLLRLA